MLTFNIACMNLLLGPVSIGSQNILPMNTIQHLELFQNNLTGIILIRKSYPNYHQIVLDLHKTYFKYFL
jgi:hypothetical protein